MTITAAILEATLKKLGHKYFINGDYNLNLIGIRTSSTGNKVTNAFDDFLAVAFKVDGIWGVKVWPCTVDNGGGTARVVCGQYPGSHAIGLHQGKYEALRQVGPLVVERDYTKDGIYNASKKETGVFGINIHKAGADLSKFCGGWFVETAHPKFCFLHIVFFNLVQHWAYLICVCSGASYACAIFCEAVH